jgi:hypothetical protein
MRKTIIAACLFVLLFACNRKPYAEHKVKLDKKANDCSSMTPAFRLNSNFGGERYEFEKCLPADYDKSSIVSERHGDTVVVRFALPPGKYQPALFQVTLDIDSYPGYKILKIDEDVYTLTPTDK